MNGENMSSDSEEDLDHDVQALLLEQLHKYADGLLDDTNNERETKKNKKSSERIHAIQRKHTPKEKTVKSIQSDSKPTPAKNQSFTNLTPKTVVKKGDKKAKETVRNDKESSFDLSVIDDKSCVEKSTNNKTLKKTSKKKNKKVDDSPMEQKSQRLKGMKILPKADILFNENEDFEDDDDIEDGSDFTDSEFGDSESFKDDSETHGSNSTSHSSSQKHLEDFKKKLGLTEKDFAEYKSKKEKSIQVSNRINSLPLSTVRGKKRPPPEVIVFEDPAKRTKKAKTKTRPVGRKQALQDFLDKKQSENLEFDLISAKHEVHKFGIEGLDKLSKEEATVHMLVKLGAKPPKKKCINYKELIKQKKEDQQKKQQAMAVDKHYLGPSTFDGKSKKKKGKGGRNNSDLGDGQIGKYKHGVQFIKADEIKKVKSTKSHRGKR